MHDIRRPLTIRDFMQILTIFFSMKWTWLWEVKGEYTAKSLYLLHFAGLATFAELTLVS
jgi:hypothetical protein